MKKLLPAALCGITLLFAAPAAFAENAVAAAVQRLHLSPQQLLSLRDFLGAFSRGVAVEASGGGLFVLRDARSMAYTGEFSLRTDRNGTLVVDRIGGPATLDAAREVVVPLRMDAKARLQATTALADSQAFAGNGALPQQQIEGAAPTNGAQAASILQSRGVFFRDGSGYAITLRASMPAAHAAPAPLRISERYYAPIKSDGKTAWRPQTVEIGGDVALGFADLESRYACAAAGPCTIGRMPAAANLHAIRWGKQNITAVPVTLMAELTAPAQTPPVPANTALGPPAETAPQTPPPDTSPAPSDTTPATPEHSSGA